MKKQNIEVEGGELAVRNSHGDVAIIPKRDRAKVQAMIDKGCDTCVDLYVSRLPRLQEYAADGSLYPDEPSTPTISPSIPNESNILIAALSKPKPFNNIVEKQDYWDTMLTKYGRHVRNKTDYMDRALDKTPLRKGIAKYNPSNYPYSEQVEDLELQSDAAYDEYKVARDKVGYDRNYADLTSKEYNDYHNYIIKNKDKDNPTPFNALNTALQIDGEAYSDMVNASDNYQKSIKAKESAKEKEFKAYTNDITRDQPPYVETFNYAYSGKLPLHYAFASSLEESNDPQPYQQPNLYYGTILGLDHIGSTVDKLIKKGYLNADIKDKMEPYEFINEKKELTLSATFTTYKDIIAAYSATLDYERDRFIEFIEDKGDELNYDELNFWNIIAYNAGQGTAREMYESYKEKGLTSDDYLSNDFDPPSYHDPYVNTMRRYQSGNMLLGEGYIPTIKNK